MARFWGIASPRAEHRVALHRITLAALLAVAGLATAPPRTWGQSFVLDPPSPSLLTIPATPGDILFPTGGLPAAPPPSVGLTAAQIGLLPGDVIDALSAGDDGAPGTIYFSVDRASLGFPTFARDVNAEATLVPPLTQSDAPGDVFATNDPACVPFGANSQVLDGNGAPLGPPPVCYPGLGTGLVEILATPGPPFNDNISAFDWSLPGRMNGANTCIFFSLAPGSPTLTPGSNPAYPFGGTPGDIFVSCPGPFPSHSVFVPATSLGLVSGPPGCAPPVCDDIDAFVYGGTFLFSLSPASPSVPAFSPADLLFPGPVVAFPAASLGLLASDNVDALEVVSNPCPVPAIGDPDGDGVGLCDNCPAAFNPGQEDSDFDGAGDACDTCTDVDGDGYGNPGFPASTCPLDNCPISFDPSQADGDLDGAGDVCDNCPMQSNPSQADTDGDSRGDACDNCPSVGNYGQQDADADGPGDACDNCPAAANAGQANADGDVSGDACDICPGSDDADFANPCRKLYGVATDDEDLRLMHPSDGRVLNTVTMTGTPTIIQGNGLATDPTNGDLYAIVRVSGGGGRRLVRVDPLTGNTTLIGDTGDNFAGITFDCNGTLYGVTGFGASTPKTLYTLSKVNAAPTLVVALGNGSGGGETISFNPEDQLIYHASGCCTPNASQIFETVDPSSLAVTNVPLSGFSYGELLSLAYDNTSGDFIAADDNGNFLRMTPAGAVTQRSELIVDSIKGMAFSDAGNACACPPTPDLSCTTGFGKGMLLAKDNVLNKEKLIAKFLKGPAITQTDLGDPTVANGTKYTLCIYAGTTALAAKLEVDRAGDTNCGSGSSTCWKALGGAPPGGTGYSYKDTALASDGVLKLLAKGGGAGKSKIIIKGKGANLAPLAIPAGLTGSTSVTMQLRGSDAPGPGCYSIALSTVSVDSPGIFKIK